MNRIYLITMILLLLALIFAIQNTATVSLHMLFWKTETSIAFVTILIFTIGFAAGWLLEAGKVWKKNNQLKSIQKKLDEVQKSLNASMAAQEKQKG